MRIKENTIVYLWLAALLLASIFVRFYFLQGFSLSNDELSAVNRLQFNGLSEVIKYGVRPDGHPAGAQILLFAWTSIFGNYPFMVRFPFVLLSSLAPLFAFLFARRSGHLTGALLFSTFIAFAQFFVLYGLLARPYGIGLSLSLAAAWLWHMLLFNQERRKFPWANSLGLALIWSLMAYMHYFSGLMAIIMALSGLFFIKRFNRIAYGVSLGLAALFFAPHIGISLYQLGLGGVGSWLAPPTST